MPAAPDLQLSITCLCAEWCGTCRDWRAAFDALVAAHPRHRWRWLDIEDEAELAGDLDIETFPTLLVADAAGQVLFAGPVLPRAADAQRLVEALLETLAAGRRPAPLQLPADQLQAYAELAQRLRAPTP